MEIARTEVACVLERLPAGNAYGGTFCFNRLLATQAL
jgi:hypothetical protein